jgi:large subunit ribosomal protein L3
MTQIFDPDGKVIPVTVIEAGPCYITQIKTLERDGYQAVQMGFGQAKRLNRPQAGHLEGLPPVRHLREIQVSSVDGYEVGQRIEADAFSVGDFVDVTGISKGRGFAGGMKRHGFGGGPRTHGQSDRARAVGSIGAMGPGRVFKGTRMPGHYGNERVTVQNLQVMLVDKERNLLAIKGAVPGARNGLVMVREAVKRGRSSKSA